METKTLKVDAEVIAQIKQDISLIKDHILGETELTNWAKNELAKARDTPKSEYISHEEVKKMILQQ